MQEQDQIKKPADLPKANDGFTGPIADQGDGNLPDHIHPDTLMAKGVDPDTKKTEAVSLAVLQHQHGEEKGLKLYRKVAVAGGFFDPSAEPSGSHFWPDLPLDGLKDDVRAKVETILNAK